MLRLERFVQAQIRVERLDSGHAEIPAYCAVALAGLGGLPDMLLSRSVIIRMRPRKASETVEDYRRRVHKGDGEKLQERLVECITPLADTLADAWPAMPNGVTDREADVGEPLLAADAAGSTWPDKARVSAVTLVTLSKQRTPSLGVKLLEDIRAVFDDHDHMFTDDLLTALRRLEEPPWDDLKGKPLNARGLAQRLRQYDVTSTSIRGGSEVAKGYKREDLWDPWQRYLAPPRQEPDTPVTPMPPHDDATRNRDHPPAGDSGPAIGAGGLGAYRWGPLRGGGWRRNRAVRLSASWAALA